MKCWDPLIRGSSIRSWVKVKGLRVSCSVMLDSLWPHGLQPTRLLCPWDSPCKNAGVGCHFLLQGIFLTQGSNPGLLHCRQILYRRRYKGSYQVLAHPQLLWTIENVIGSWKITKIWEKRKSWGRIEWQRLSPTWAHSFKAGRGCCFNNYRSQDRVKTMKKQRNIFQMKE